MEGTDTDENTSFESLAAATARIVELVKAYYSKTGEEQKEDGQWNAGGGDADKKYAEHHGDDVANPLGNGDGRGNIS